MPIRQLPQHLINKIAAGEVIERPASVVKELVENALDAGATRIDVAIEDGGRKCIGVADNGCGMGEEDLSLAFTPHATSKIADEDDLFSIATMGFRGEALTSIASISHAHIRTHQRGAAFPAAGGFEAEASGQTLGQVRPCAAAAGTTVTVRDLFFNTPARRKFLKAASTELGHVSEQLARAALPYPQVAFTLTHNGKKVYNLPAVPTTIQRISDLFGAELAQDLLPIASRGGLVGIAGLIAPPASARATAKWQYFFLNGRYIRDRLLGHALREAYRGLADPNRSPAAFVFLKIEPTEVDVNVHPTKIEVRFRDSQLVYGEVLAALRATLNRASLTPTAAMGDAPGAITPPAISADAESRRDSIRQALADFFKSASPQQTRLNFPAHPAPAGSAASADKEGEYQAEARPSHYAQFQRETPSAVPSVPHTQQKIISDEVAGAARQPVQTVTTGSTFLPETTDKPATIKISAMPAGQAIQIHNSYIVAPCDDGLVIIDQHALHERLIYNDLRRRLTCGKLASQQMLIPQPLAVTAAEADLLERFGALLATLGIEVASFGPSAVAIQRFPSLLAERGTAAAEFMRQLLDRLAEDETTDSERLLEDILEMLACKAAIKAGQPLGAAEISELLARREECQKASSCPHGRPTALKLTLKDLEKQFKRT